MSSGSAEQPQDQIGHDQSGQAQFGQAQFGQAQSGQQPGWPPPPTYGPAGPYVHVGAGWPQAPGRRTNGLAIAALCCSIGQLILGPLAGIAAIVLGAISLKQIRVSGEDGHGMALTGLVLGIVGIILFVILLVVLIALVNTFATNVNNFNGVTPQPSN
ncbi:MAG TPA: DUF4190 domain-containing protein [Streptosporangiaceae bacterium]|nr:DUF4190 domain-containing protein [Streptosporangiaceae bacterium]